MDTRSDLESPRLTQLLTDLERSDPTITLSDFWQECADRGTPIVEDYDPDAGSALTTFVWRAEYPVDNVVLVEWISQGDFADKQLHHLAGTDVWYRSLRLRDDLRASYQVSPNDSLVPKREETDWETRQRGWVRDPLNSQPLLDFEPVHEPELARFDSSILSMPRAVPQPWLGRKPGIPQGRIKHYPFESNALGNSRSMWVYTPAGYDPAVTPLPLLILYDGERHESVMRVPIVLDNLIAAHEIPPIVAVMIGNVDRGIELPCHQPFAHMLAHELVPWLIDRYPISADPLSRVTAGQSYGGLAAVYAAIMHPDVFGQAISQSGSFWWKPDPLRQETPRVLGDAPEYCWLPALVANRPRVPIRIWMEVGRLEDRSFGDGIPGMVPTNRHFRDVLVAKEYDVRYREFGGGHDYACWRHSLADGLIATLGGQWASGPWKGTRPHG